MSEANGDKPHGRADLMRDLVAGETQCTARSKRTGQRCKRASSLGSNVCRAHGSEAPQTKAKAQRRLAQAADVLVQRLLSFALDGDVADPVALQAIRDALDRAGLKPGVEVGVTVKPYESILEQIDGGSRADYRRARGIADTSDQPAALVDAHRELPTADSAAPIDAEIVDEGDELIAAMRPRTRINDEGQPITPGEAEHGSGGGSAPGTGPTGNAMMPLHEAVNAAAQMRRDAAHGHAVIRRALPRGRPL